MLVQQQGSRGLDRVDALEILGRSEFPLAPGLNVQLPPGQWQGIKDEGFELGRLELKLPAVFIDPQHPFFYRVQGQGGGSREKLFDEASAQQVDSDAAEGENELSPGLRKLRLVRRQVGVFDDLRPAIPGRHHADLLSGPGFLQHLQAHVASGEIVEAGKYRVRQVDERVVDLEVEEMLYLPGKRIGEGSGIPQRAVAAAMSVGAEEDAAGCLQDELAPLVEDGQGCLPHEDDISGREAEVVVPLEVVTGHCVRRRAGHDVPGQGGAVDRAETENLRRVDLEERFT